jgi:hypothetical protein
MVKTASSILTASAVALCMVGSLPAARADVLRIAVVVADNEADYANNAALAPTFEALLKKGTGVKDVHVGVDPAKMTIASSSVWPNADDIRSVTDTSEWKATVGKLKAKPFTPEVFQITPP